ncbi:MAG: FtsX-like permease family protein, partial [Bacteroidales bacterium]|nr:FtsX-like permease family protein [Bacteroidales bacterium]
FFKKFEFTPFCHGDTDTLRLLAIVGLLLLFSAIFNYINLSFALTGKRAREMAMRRLLGAEKRAVIGKYIAESILFTAVCFALGLLLAYAFAPAVNSLLNNPDVPIRVHLTPGYLLVYVLLIALVGTLAGLLPALLAGRYKPVDIVRGTFRRSTRMTFSKIFIVLQNALAVFLIAMALIMEAQYRTSLHRPLHVNIKNMVLVRALAQSGTDALEASLAALPCVRQMGRANAVPLSSSQGQYSVTPDGRDILYRYYRVDSAAFRMLGFEVQKDYRTPLTGGVWFGETAFAATGLTDDDLTIDILSQRTGGDCDHVAGIISDFPVEADNMGADDPVIVTVRPSEELSGYLLEISGDTGEARRAIQETLDSWKQTTQVYYSDMVFVEDSLREGLRPARNNMRLLEVFMILAVIISLLGLVAMSTYFAGERASSIAVRKVFGGTVKSELFHSVRDYMVMVAVACAIGIPVAVWAARRYLEGFTVKLQDYGWIFVVAVLISLAFAFASVLWQTLKAARTNPAVELKKE